MKASKVAAVVTALLATDAKPSETQILAAIIAADKRGKDEGGLGPVEIQDKPKKGEDEFPPKEKAEDEKDDEKAKDADMDDDMSEDEKDDEKAEDESDVQPKQSVTGGGKPKGNAGEEPARDKKGMDAAIRTAIDARDALHAARRAVEPVLGVVTYDSAAEVYKAALVKMGVDTAGVHASAFPSLFGLARDKANAQTPTMASDAASVKTMAAMIPSYNRLSAR